MLSYSKDVRIAAALLAVGVSLAARRMFANESAGCCAGGCRSGPRNGAPDDHGSRHRCASSGRGSRFSASASGGWNDALFRRTCLPMGTLPAPRRPSTEQPNSEAAEPTAHPPAPQISPQLSAGDQASFERATNDDLATAEKSLQQASGRQLNAAQQDLAGKIRSFTDQARDAGKGGDWTRAQNLAQKARLLSIELINSL